MRLAKAIPSSKGTITVNRRAAIENTSSRKPDLVITNEEQKQVILIDVTCPFENRMQGFVEARARKIEHYTPLANELRAKGYYVYLDAFIVGSLGSWDPANGQVLKALGINRRYAKMMLKLMTSDTIRWSRGMYVEHVTGIRQYTAPAVPLVAPPVVRSSSAPHHAEASSTSTGDAASQLTSTRSSNGHRATDTCLQQPPGHGISSGRRSKSSSSCLGLAPAVFRRSSPQK